VAAGAHRHRFGAPPRSDPDARRCQLDDLWGGGPLSPLGADAPAASEAWLALSTVSTSVSVFGCTKGKACFSVVLFLFLLL